MGDTGLLCALCMANIQFDILQGNVDVNMGSILENVMAQSIRANGFNLHYFDSKKIGELDFVIQNGMDIDLLEIKSGKDYKKHAALNKAMQIKDWRFNKVSVFCKDNIQIDGKITYYPWYMIIFYKPHEIPKRMIVEIDVSKLT